MSIQRQHRLDRHIHVLKPILLKHDLHHLLPIRLGVHRGLGEEHLAPVRIDPEFLLKGVVPEVLHVFPVSDDAVFHGLGDLEVVAVFGGFVADHDVFDDSGADALFSAQDGAADDGGEDWGVRMDQDWSELGIAGWRTMFWEVGSRIANFDKLRAESLGAGVSGCASMKK